jgi:hypothetical protein
MVNFENDQIMNASAKKIVTIIYLQRLEWLFDAWEEYYTSMESEIHSVKSIGRVRARLITLFSEIESSYKASLKEHDYLKLKDFVKVGDVEDMEEATRLISEFMYNKNITKIDTAKPYDPCDLEMENSVYGL